MKFPHLPIGSRFRFDGHLYTKTGPVAASDETGKTRMIPRWAVLQPVDGEAPPPPPKPARRLDEAAVLQAFEAYHAGCAQLLQDVPGGAAALAALREQFLASM